MVETSLDSWRCTAEPYIATIEQYHIAKTVAVDPHRKNRTLTNGGIARRSDAERDANAPADDERTLLS